MCVCLCLRIRVAYLDRGETWRRVLGRVRVCTSLKLCAFRIVGGTGGVKLCIITLCFSLFFGDDVKASNMRSFPLSFIIVMMDSKISFAFSLRGSAAQLQQLHQMVQMADGRFPNYEIVVLYY